MSAAPIPILTLDDSPADEYDRQLDDRRSKAKRTIRRCFWAWLLGHAFAAAAIALLVVTLVVAFDGKDLLALLTLGGAGTSAISAALLWTVPAGRAAFIVARDRGVLSWPWIVYGLVPWLGVCTELSAVFGLRLLGELV